MEMFEKVMQLIATHALALGVGLSAGLILENLMAPLSKLRGRVAKMLDKAEEAVKEEE